MKFNGSNLSFFQVYIILYLQKAADCSTADRAFVRLHPYYLRAVDAQAHVSARQHHGVLVCRVADHALLLTFISQISGSVVNSENVVQVHNLVVVEQLLLQKFVSQTQAIFLECAVGELDVLFTSAFITIGIDCLN